MIENKPFVPQRFQEERDKDTTRVFPIRFNKREINSLESDAKLLGEYKLTTTVKLLIELGRSVLQREETRLLLDARLKNEHRNIKKGIELIDPIFWKL